MMTRTVLAASALLWASATAGHRELQSAIAAHAWEDFLRNPTANDDTRQCIPAGRRNATTDYRNLSSLLGVGVARRRKLACEQPSLKEHLRRLDRAATALNHSLRVVQIGANAGDAEANEWIGTMIRQHRWRAALVEPVPHIFSQLIKSYRPYLRSCNSVDNEGQCAGSEPGATARTVDLHQVVVHHNRSAIQREGGEGRRGRCPFLYVKPECRPGTATYNRRSCGWKAGMRLEQMGRVSGLPPRKARVDINPASGYWLDRSAKHMDEKSLPCVAIADLFAEVGLPDVDVLTIDTEGYDYFLLSALDFARVSPLAIEIESKSFSRRQLAEAQRLLERQGYRVLDGNASPDATHWQGHTQILEIFAVKQGARARP